MGISDTPPFLPDDIHVRARPEQSLLIGRAVDRSGLTRSDFVLEAACREAEDIVLDQVYFPLTAQEYARFVALLDHPPAPGPGLVNLVNAESPWE